MTVLPQRSRRHRLLALAALFAALALALWALPALAWKIAEAGVPYAHKGSGYSIEFPSGWKYDKMLFSDESVATQDGPSLAVVYVDFRKHKKAFPTVRKASSPDMLPADLAQLVVADLQAASGIEDVQVLADEPAELAGLPAFRLHLAYRVKAFGAAVRYEHVVTGVAHPRGLYLVGYRAPKLVYFARDLAAFEAAAKTFAIAAEPARR